MVKLGWSLLSWLSTATIEIQVCSVLPPPVCAEWDYCLRLDGFPSKRRKSFWQSWLDHLILVHFHVHTDQLLLLHWVIRFIALAFDSLSSLCHTFKLLPCLALIPSCSPLTMDRQQYLEIHARGPEIALLVALFCHLQHNQIMVQAVLTYNANSHVIKI